MTRSPWIDPQHRFPDFVNLPPESRVRAFGVDYGHIKTADGGDLYLTQYGWPFLQCLLPENWYAGKWYSLHGEKLKGSTGHVYRVPTKPVKNTSMDIVVKFSRVGQEVPLVITTTLLDDIAPADIASARFNSPMEEFGLVMEMRQGAYGPRDIRLLTHRPLAIYALPNEFELWRLGRSRSRFRAHQHLLAVDQENAAIAIELDIKRQYVVLYAWLKGMNAEDACSDNLITDDDLHELTWRAVREMRHKGFKVLDTKPKHFILRQNGDGAIVRRGNRIAYGLVDFELLERTEEYQREFKTIRRAHYWELQSQRESPPATPLPPQLSRHNLFGVEYVYGTTPNGGKIWAVGNNPELFDYFLPDRWRRTPRLKLSVNSEVYRTRTRDNIHVVYRQSRVGVRPPGDPFYDHDKQIRDFGYNSPFEEVAIAEHLRQLGIPTIYPRAIYRTGHQSTKAGYLQDKNRYLTHAHLLDPDDEPVLSAHHDYYTIWGYWRGIDPRLQYSSEPHRGFVDLEKAFEDNLLSNQTYHHLFAQTRRQLADIGFDSEIIEPYELLLSFDASAHLIAEDSGELRITMSIDALTAHEYELLDEAAYRELIEHIQGQLESIGCDALNLTGNHLLLSMNPRGEIVTDTDGRPRVTLGNFEFMKLTSSSLA